MSRPCSRILGFSLPVVLAFPLATALPITGIGEHGGDAVLKAMKLELDRSMALLKLGQMQTPYYIEYSVMEVDGFTADTSLGAVKFAMRVRSRWLRAVVRVGSYKQDSYYQQGRGSIEVMPVDDDPVVLRRQLWLATDKAYKQAIEALAAKQAKLKQYQVQDPVDDFARQSAVESIGPLARLNVDEAQWVRNLEAASALSSELSEVEALDVAVRFIAINHYFMNSEGAAVRRGQTVYGLGVSASVQAPDGMRLFRSPGWVFGRAEELPTTEGIKTDVRRMLTTLKALRQAPLVDENEYRGPVLFDSEAAVDIFESLVAPSVLGNKPALGAPARTTGHYANSYKTRVLPEFLSVVDDPTLSSFGGRTLVGKFSIDDEGVQAAPVTVMDRGILVNYLMGRQPIRDFAASNGHGRAGADLIPSPHIGNLIVRTSQAIPRADLKKKLVDLCSERSLPYGYYVQTLGPGLAPRLLYRVWVKDGREELVRGAAFGELDLRALRSELVAVGDDPRVENRLPQTNIANTLIVPSLLFGEIEVRRAGGANEKLPSYPPPTLSGTVP